MNTPAKRESLPAVTAAGVVAIIFSAFAVLGSLLMGVSLLVAPEIQTRQGVPVVPAATKAMSEVMIVFLLAVAVSGIFVGVGILRRRNWARITILVWAGFMTFVSVCAIAFVLVIFNAIPNQLPDTADAAPLMKFIKFFVVIFYGIPAGIGVWWLILFTRRRVATAFTNPAEFSPAMDPSGFPHVESAMQAPSTPKPSCPLLLAILAGLFIFSGFFTTMFATIPLPFPFPMYLFGHVYSGSGPRIFLAVLALVMGIAGVGMLKLKSWGLHTALLVQSVFFVNGLFAAVSPAFLADMGDAMEKMSGQSPTMPGGNPFLSVIYFRSILVLSVVFGGIIIGLLVFLRSRFLEQAAAAEAAKL
jgi:hypothetical protein